MRRILREEVDDSPVAGMLRADGEPLDSLDAQIDALITKYEKEAIDAAEQSSSDEIMESLQSLSLRFLFEAEGDPPPEGVDPSAEPPAEKKPADKEVEEEKPRLDIDQFTSKVARLVMNSSSLLPVEEVIVSRAMKYLRDNYDQSYVEQMQDILNNQYDFDLEGDKEVIDVPIAAGAATKSGG